MEVVGLLALGLRRFVSAANVQVVDQIVANVNGDIVSQDELSACRASWPGA